MHSVLLMTYRWAFFFFSCLTLSLFIVGCSNVYRETEDRYDYPKDIEKRVLVISGTADVGFRIKFMVDYVPSKDTKVICRRYDPLETGKWFPPVERYYQEAVVTEGHYKLGLSLSDVEPGFCEWKPSAIHYAINLASEKPSHFYVSLISIGNANGTSASSITLSCAPSSSKLSPNFVICKEDVQLSHIERAKRTIMKNQETFEVNFVYAAR